MLILASHNPEEHVLPHRFFELMPWNFNFGLKQLPILNMDFGPKQFYFTNHLLMTLVAAGLCLLILPRIARSYSGGSQQAPRGFTNLFEAMLQFIRNDVVRPVLNHRTDAFIPFLWTLFFFILFCNLLGLIPFDAIIYLISGRKLEHIGGTATGNLAVTGGLALCALFTIHACGIHAVYVGLREGTYGTHHDEGHPVGHGDPGAAHQDHPHYDHNHGVAPIQAALAAPLLYVWNFAPHVFAPHHHRSKPSPVLRAVMIPIFVIYTAMITRGMFTLFGIGNVGQWLGAVLGIFAGFGAGGFHALDFVDVIMWVILFLLETIGALIKPFALMIRLFANMIAGHIVLASILALTFIMGSYAVGVAASIGCALLSLLELFVAFLQAYIFVFLTTLFIGAAVAPEH